MQFRQGRRAPLFVLGTGGGKTVVFSYIAHGAAARGNRVCILVHRQELVRQTSRSLTEMGVPHGVISPRATPNYAQAVQVASVQTLARRIGNVPAPSLIVVDEAHHAVAGQWSQVLQAWPAARVLGVTATPERLDGRGLGQEFGGPFDCMVQGPPVADLIARGYLSRPVYYAPPWQLDLSGVHTRMGDFAKGEAAERVDRPVITGDAVEHYRRICPGEPAIAFCASVKHAEHVAESFRAAGVASASLDGSLSDNERAQRILDLGNRRISVLTSCEIVSEGFDLPVVTAAILLRPTQSLSLHLQQVGRVLRIHPGKTCSYILDHVGNCVRLGIAEEPRDWSLEGRTRGKRGPNAASDNGPEIKQCSRCYCIHVPAPACPECGFTYELAARELEQVDGELKQVDADELQARRRAKWERRREMANCETLEELQAYGASKGYKPGWAFHVMAQRSARRASA